MVGVCVDFLYKRSMIIQDFVDIGLEVLSEGFRDAFLSVLGGEYIVVGRLWKSSVACVSCFIVVSCYSKVSGFWTWIVL